MLGAQIASLHNIAFYLRLVTEPADTSGPGISPLGRSGWSPNSAAGCNTRTTMKRKLPHFRFPGFKILDRYILGKFLSTYFFAIAMIIVVVVIFDYVEKIDNFTETKAPLKRSFSTIT